MIVFEKKVSSSITAKNMMAAGRTHALFAFVPSFFVALSFVSLSFANFAFLLYTNPSLKQAYLCGLFTARPRCPPRRASARRCRPPCRTAKILAKLRMLLMAD